MGLHIELMAGWLNNLQNESIPAYLYGYLYIRGYMSKEEFEKTQSCESGAYVPKLSYIVSDDISLELHDMCDREQYVEDWRLIKHNQELESQMFKEMFS